VIDLHTHSLCSDGTDSPAHVVELAAASGCKAVALTDHDTLVGLPAAREAAGRLGIELVPGCEVSCRFLDRSVHVLVYFVEEPEGPLQDELALLRHDRVSRNRALIARLVELGLPVTYDELVAEADSEESAGRPHVAAILVRKGIVSNVPEAFDVWLGDGRPAYVPKARISPAEIAGLARRSGGVAVLAHPFTLDLTHSELDAAVGELAEAGLSGLEAYYGRYSPDQRRGLVDMAQRHGLVATGGSDYHGTVKADLSVGRGTGDLSVPDHALTDLQGRRVA